MRRILLQNFRLKRGNSAAIKMPADRFPVRRNFRSYFLFALLPLPHLKTYLPRLVVLLPIILPALLLLPALLPASAVAQSGPPDEYEIRMSGNYYWGEAVSMVRSEAISLARSDLIGKIVILVVSEQVHGISEDDEQFSSYYESASRTISRMELRGLDHTVIERRDGSFQALAWLHKDDYARSLELERERQIGLAEHAAGIERREGLDRAIPVIYRAFLNTYYFPEPLYLTDESGRRVEAQQYYRSKLDRWAAGLNLIAEAPEGGMMPGDVIEITVPVSSVDRDRPSSELKMGFDIAGYGYRKTVGGNTRLFLERLPDRPKESITVRFRPALEDTRANREWMVLAEEVGPWYRRDLAIDFSPIITVDFTAREIAGNAWRFQSRIDNLSLNHIEWDFGDGTFSDERNPAHQYKRLDSPVRVTLRVNRNPELTVVKELGPQGLRAVAEAVRTEPARSDPAPSIHSTFQWQEMTTSPENRRYLRTLSGEEDAGEILRSLQTRARHQNIRYGNRAAIQIVDESFVVIVDPESLRVRAFLSPVQQGSRFDLKTGNRIINFEEAYRGYGTIWIEP